jgi:Mrp family chromosome partitioning ATPase
MGNILEALQKAHRQKRERVDKLQGEFESSVRTEGDGLRAPDLLLLENPTSGAAEQFHMARNMIRQSGRERPIRTLLVTSPQRVSGASLVTCNLAAAFVSEPEGEILIVDTVPGGQRLSASFGADGLPGLFTYLAGVPGDAVDPDELLPLCRKTDIRRLHFLPAGRPEGMQDSPFLRSELGEVPRVLAEYYRVVFIDAPPVLENMDVAVFAAAADAVILVVESGVTSREGLARSVQLLRGSGSNLLGCILSGASEDIPRWLRRILVGPSA